MARGARKAKYKSDSAILARLIKDVRRNCYECCGDSFKEVEICTIPDCALYPWRLGVPQTPPKSSISGDSSAEPACKPRLRTKTIASPVEGGGVA